MNKVKVFLLILWAALLIAVFTVNSKYFAESIAGMMIIDKALEIFQKDYK